MAGRQIQLPSPFTEWKLWNHSRYFMKGSPYLRLYNNFSWHILKMNHPKKDLHDFGCFFLDLLWTSVLQCYTYSRSTSDFHLYTFYWSHHLTLFSPIYLLHSAHWLMSSFLTMYGTKGFWFSSLLLREHYNNLPVCIHNGTLWMTLHRAVWYACNHRQSNKAKQRLKSDWAIRQQQWWWW